MMDLFVLRYLLLHGFLHVSMATQCSLLQNCAIQLKNLLNHTLDSEIQLCLNVVGKQSELQNCETQAVTTCALGGHEPEYIEYQIQKLAANQKCLEECPNMDEVKICQDKIKYDIIQTSGYSQFCSNYNDQTKCVEEKLKLCSFRIKLFESGLSEDVRRIVRTVCSSGCSSIDTTMKSIDACNKQFSITSKDNSFTDCSSYKEYINCIQKDSPCPEFRRVAQYSQPSLLQAQNKCEPTTTSSTAAPATRPTVLSTNKASSETTRVHITKTTFGFDDSKIVPLTEIVDASLEEAISSSIHTLTDFGTNSAFNMDATAGTTQKEATIRKHSSSNIAISMSIHTQKDFGTTSAFNMDAIAGTTQKETTIRKHSSSNTGISSSIQNKDFGATFAFNMDSTTGTIQKDHTVRKQGSSSTGSMKNIESKLVVMCVVLLTSF